MSHRVGLALLIAIGSLAGAQSATSSNPLLISRLSDSAGVIRGMVRDSTGRPIQAQVAIPERRTFVMADDSGRFRLTTDTGSFMLLSRAIGLKTRRDSVSLPAHRGIELDIVMRRIAFDMGAVCTQPCEAASRAPALSGLQPPRARSLQVGHSPVVMIPRGASAAEDSVALLMAMYGAAFSNAVATAHAAAAPAVVCVEGLGRGVDPPSAVLEALQKNRTTLIRPMSACRVEPLGDSRRQAGASLVIDTLTGRRGISISVTAPVFSDDVTLKFNTGYYQHGLSAAGFACDARRDRDNWIVTRCELRWIS